MSGNLPVVGVERNDVGVFSIFFSSVVAIASVGMGDARVISRGRSVGIIVIEEVDVLITAGMRFVEEVY
jgi:hypothetical protein